MSYNEHTKKKMQTGIPSKEYQDNYDKIFGKGAFKEDTRDRAVREFVEEDFNASKPS
jgi:hypothetical protein